MSESRGMSVKAYLTLEDDTQEVRRFGIPEGASTNYSYLQERIRDIFNLGSKIFKIHWQDSEGDLISISSDEELFEAITENVTNNGPQLLRVFVTITENKSENTGKGGLHVGVVCDGCDGKIFGMRYKCKSCIDFDLCSSCESKGVHKHHQFMKITVNEFPGFGFATNAHAEGFFGDGPSKSGRSHGRHHKWAHHQQQRQQQQQQQQRQQQPHFFGGGCNQFGNKDENKQKPFEFSFNNSSVGGIPFGFGFGFAPPTPMNFPGTEAFAEGAEKFASQMASQVTSQLTSQHIADIMKGMWTAWAGDQGTSPREPQGSSSDSNENKSSSKDDQGTSEKKTKENSGIINIDISLDEDISTEAKQKSAKASNEQETAVAEVILMETDEPNQSQSGQSTPSGAEEWTLLNKERESSAEVTQAPKDVRETTEAAAAVAHSEEQHNQPLYPTLPILAHPNERVRNALSQMQGMGYSDEGGWLTRLLEMKDGDINKVLDILLVQRK